MASGRRFSAACNPYPPPLRPWGPPIRCHSLPLAPGVLVGGSGVVWRGGHLQRYPGLPQTRIAQCSHHAHLGGVHLGSVVCWYCRTGTTTAPRLLRTGNNPVPDGPPPLRTRRALRTRTGLHSGHPRSVGQHGICRFSPFVRHHCHRRLPAASTGQPRGQVGAVERCGNVGRVGWGGSSWRSTATPRHSFPCSPLDCSCLSPCRKPGWWFITIGTDHRDGGGSG